MAEQKEIKNINKAVLFSGGGRIDIEETKALLYDSLKGKRAAYIGAANGDRVAFFENMKTMLLRLGIKKVDFLRLARKDVDEKEVRKILKEADIIFISGGEVEDGMKWLSIHNLCEYLKVLFNEGKQFICVSAGTIMMGSHWFSIDESKKDSNPTLIECLGIIPTVFDTHAEDEDWIELKTTLRLLGEGSIGHGIPSFGMITADGSGNLVGYDTDILEYRYKNDNFTITVK